MIRFRPWAALAVLALGASGCDPADEGLAEGETTIVDSTGAFDGLSPEQIRRQAEPMSPAVAESLGIIDTTIHIEDPRPGDPAIPPELRDSVP